MPVGGFTGLPATRQPPANKLMRLFSEMERVTIGPFAGVIEEEQRRLRGARPRSFLKAAKGGFRRRLTYFDVIESTPLALAMTVGLDPAVPALGAVGKLIKLPATIRMARMASMHAQHLPMVGRALTKAQLALGKSFKPGFEAEKLLGGAQANVIRKLQEARVRDIERFAITAEDELEDIIKLAKSPEERKIITRMIERNIRTERDMLPSSVVGDYFSLSDDGKVAARLALTYRLKLEKIKIDAGFLPREMVDRFIEAHQINYVAHRAMTVRETIKWAQKQAKIIRRAEAKDPSLVKQVFTGAKKRELTPTQVEAMEQGSVKSFEELSDSLSRFRTAPEQISPAELSRRMGQPVTFQHRRVVGTFERLVDELIEPQLGPLSAGEKEAVLRLLKAVPQNEEILPAELFQAYRALSERGKGAVKLGWRYRGGRSMTVEEIASANVREVSLDIADLLRTESVEVGTALANKRYFEALSKHMAANKLMISDGISDPLSQIDHYAKVLARGATKPIHHKQARRAAEEIVSRGLTKIDDPAFEGFLVPEMIAGDLRRLLGTFDTPGALKGFFKTFTKLNNFFKGWTLALFPGYHARNIVTDAWFNFASGMGPQDFQHTVMATRLMAKKLRGIKFDKKEKAFFGMTEANLMNSARIDRVIGAGLTRGEMGPAMRRTEIPRTGIGKLLMPDSNRFIRGGYKFGQTLEDTQRLAQYMWRLSKGDTREVAAAFVRKWHYDPLYGITDFEKSMFSNFLFPFYAWYRFNLPLQLRSIVERPGRTLLFPKSIQAIENEFGGPTPNEEHFPEWMKRTLMMRARYDSKTGTYRLFSFNGWHPFADLNAIMGRREFSHAAKSLLSPFIKLPIEFLENYDFFRGREIEKFPGQRGRVLGVPMRRLAEHFVRSIRLFNEVDRTIWDIESGLPFGVRIFRSIGLKPYPADPRIGRRSYKRDLDERIRTLTFYRKLEVRKRRPDERQLKNIDRLLRELKAERAGQ